MSISACQVAIVILAAGISRRFGAADKIATLLRGRALGLHIADNLRDIEFAQRIAVVGAADPGFADMGYGLLYNSFPERGLGYSVGLGVAAVQDDSIEAVLIVLADMPNVSSSHITQMLDQFDGDRLGSAYNACVSPPALFGRAHFPALCALTGDKGARGLLRDAPALAAHAHILRDVDTPHDLAVLLTDEE